VSVLALTRRETTSGVNVEVVAGRVLVDIIVLVRVVGRVWVVAPEVSVC
jgi:hypothetical protein